MKIILHGPQGYGKTQAANVIINRYKIKRVIEEWDGVTNIPEGALAVTNLKPPFNLLGVTVIRVGDIIP